MREALTALAGSALPTLMVLVGILLNRNDSDMMMLMSSNAALDARVSKLEEKSEKCSLAVGI